MKLSHSTLNCFPATRYILFLILTKWPFLVLNGPQHLTPVMFPLRLQGLLIRENWSQLLRRDLVFSNGPVSCYGGSSFSPLLGNLIRLFVLWIRQNPMTRRHRCVCELFFQLQKLRPLHFPLPNSDQEGKWSWWGPGPDHTSDVSMCPWQLPKIKYLCGNNPAGKSLLHSTPLSPPSQAGSGPPWQLSPSREWGQAGSSCYKDTEQRFQREGWAQERFDKACARLHATECKQGVYLGSFSPSLGGGCYEVGPCFWWKKTRQTASQDEACQRDGWHRHNSLQCPRLSCFP